MKALNWWSQRKGDNMNSFPMKSQDGFSHFRERAEDKKKYVTGLENSRYRPEVYRSYNASSVTNVSHSFDSKYS